MSIEGSTIPNGSILAGSPSRVVYETSPKEGYIALKGRVTVRDYEITQCVVKILGDGKLLWESAPLRNENKTVKPERFFIERLQGRHTGTRDRGYREDWSSLCRLDSAGNWEALSPHTSLDWFLSQIAAPL